MELGLLALLLVLAFDLLPVMIAGIVLSIAYVIYRISFPGRARTRGRHGRLRDDVLGVRPSPRPRQPGGPSRPRRDGLSVRRTADLPQRRGVQRHRQTLLIKAGEEGGLPGTMVVDCEEVILVDTTGAAALTDLLAYAQRYGVELSLARVHPGAHELLKLTGTLGELGEHRIYDTVRHAVDAATAASPSAGSGAEPPSGLAS